MAMDRTANASMTHQVRGSENHHSSREKENVHSDSHSSEQILEFMQPTSAHCLQVEFIKFRYF